MKLAPLEDVAQVFMGQSPPSSTYNTGGLGLPFFQGKADFTDLYPTIRMYCTEPNRVAETNDILMSVRAPVGPTNLSPTKTGIGRGLAAIRPNQDTDLKYLLYFLRFYEPKWAQVSKGSTFDAISRDDLESVRVPVAPLPEQRRVAALLDKADHLRRTRRYATRLSDRFLTEVFLQMFGDPRTNRMSWPLTDLGSVCPQITDGTHVTPTYVSSGVPFITVKNIVSGRVDFWDTKCIAKDEHKSLIRHAKPERGDILVSKDGTIGIPCMVDTDREFSIFVSIAILKPNRCLVDPLFLTHQIRSPGVQHQIVQGIKGIAIRHLHIEDFKQLKILLPPLELQQEFAGIVQQFDRLRMQQREAQRQAEHLFQSLLRRAFGATQQQMTDR